MTLTEMYQLAVEREDITADVAQQYVLLTLQKISDELTRQENTWSWPWSRTSQKGLYLCGPVGVGKTYLMDLFFSHVTIQKKSRFHFHHFMQQVDAQLRKHQGKKNPLRHIAAELAKTTRLLCFDEFLVDDVAGAMILAELLQALFAHRIILVATSNTLPENLYLNGPQRARFLPAIDLINTHCKLMQLPPHVDYRLGRHSILHAYLYPLNAKNQQIMEQEFKKIAPKALKDQVIIIQSRPVHCLQRDHSVAWFAFNVLCNMPRSQLDYLELANQFDTIFVSEIPQLTNHETTQALLLTRFVDVMYDQGVRLFLLAAVPLETLNISQDSSSEFQRTLSRLHEMQSDEYLKKHQHHAVLPFGQEPSLST